MENVTIERRGDALLVHLEGEVTLEFTGSLKERLEREMESGPFSMLVIDLSGVTFMDSSGLGFLVALSTRLKSHSQTMHLYKPSMQVRKTLELVQLSSFFHTVGDEDELSALLPE